MTRISLRVLAILAIAGLSACASNTEIPFDHASNSGIKTIGILTPYSDKRPHMVLASDVGQSFGLIGALVDVSLAEARDNKFEAIVKARQVDPKADFQTDLKGALAAHGYTAVDVPTDRPDSGLLKTYPKGGTVDAYLDVSVFSYGYVAAGIAASNPYRPFVDAKCRLVRASDGAVLMEDTVIYNPVTMAGVKTDHAVTIAPDPNFAYPDFDSLTGNPDMALKGLDTSLSATATAIGTLVQ